MNTSTSPSWLPFGLNLFGSVAVGYSLFAVDLAGLPVWVFVVAFAAVAAWLVRGVLGHLFGVHRLDLALCAVSALGGSLVAAPSNGVAIVPAAVAVMVVVGTVELSWGVGLWLALVSIALTAVGGGIFGIPVLAVVAMMGGIALALFAGLSRRQFRLSAAQAVLLREQQIAMREEKARIDLLGERQEVARDIHDVLAHSLGGLVIQLDAAEALLEAGEVSAAQQRVADARSLAADGLGEARRAVTALRDPAAGTPAGDVQPAALAASLDDLLAAHRSLGGVADLTVTGLPHGLGRPEAVAVQRALQEALSNARKHAPGEPVRATLDWEGGAAGQNGRVRLTVSNPLADGAHPVLAATGGGHGLEGMRERFAALPLGGSFSSGLTGDRFTLTAEAVLAPVGPA